MNQVFPIDGSPVIPREGIPTLAPVEGAPNITLGVDGATLGRTERDESAIGISIRP